MCISLLGQISTGLALSTLSGPKCGQDHVKGCSYVIDQLPTIPFDAPFALFRATEDALARLSKCVAPKLKCS